MILRQNIPEFYQVRFAMDPTLSKYFLRWILLCPTLVCDGTYPNPSQNDAKSNYEGGYEVMRLGALEFKCHWCPLLKIFRGVQAVKLYMTLRDRDLLTKKGIHGFIAKGGSGSSLWHPGCWEQLCNFASLQCGETDGQKWVV